MRPCCHFSRRDFLRWAAIVAATPIVAGLEDVERAYGLTTALKGNAALPVNLEMVTTTPTSVVLTWFTGDPTRVDQFGRMAPLPADTEVAVRSPKTGVERTVFHDTRATPYHYVELEGLEPGETYTLIARSNGVPAITAATYFGSPFGTSVAHPPAGPLVVTTPMPPPGKYLFSVALCNDLHLGETIAGLATSQAGQGIPPGIEQEPGKRPYAEIMAEALVRETRQRGADFLFAAGDVSSEASPKDLRAAHDILGEFGHAKYFVARGNHDRAHDTPESAGCSTVPGHPRRHDCFRDEFDGQGPTWFARDVGPTDLRVIGIDTYDTIGNGSFRGSVSPAQLSWLRAELHANGDRPTIVFGHHPLVLDQTSSAVPPVVYGLPYSQGRAITEMYRHAPGVFLHHAGHTHRNKRAISLNAPGVVFQEVAATKEYPGGFHMVRVYSGGYSLNFYKFRDPSAQEWSERSRPEYLGTAPNYTYGNTMDRNSTVVRDLSGLQSAHLPV